MLGVVAVGITCRDARDLGRHRNGLALVRVVEPRRSLDVYRRRNIQAGKHRVVRVVGIALGITGKTLALQTAANRDFRVVFGLSEDKVLMRDNPRFARLEQTIGVLRATGELTKHEAVMSRSLFGGIAPVNAESLAIHLKRCMQVARHAGGILAIKNTQVERRLRKAKVEQLGIELVLILRRNRKVEGPACRDFGVGLIGHRKGDFGLRCLGARQRLIDRTLVTVKRDVIGAGGVLDLVILAVDAKVLGLWHLQVGG